jgi:hypothetical protein
MSDPTDPAGAARRRQSAQRIQRQLDEALAASFPASDPVAIVTSHQEEDWLDTAPPPAGEGAEEESTER